MCRREVLKCLIKIRRDESWLLEVSKVGIKTGACNCEAAVFFKVPGRNPLSVLLLKVEFSHFDSHFVLGKRLKSACIRHKLLDWFSDFQFRR